MLQGWHADPFGLHELRYFSAGNPTKLVRDGNVEAYDEPPAQEASPAGVAVAANVASGKEAAAVARQSDSGFRGPVPLRHATAAYAGRPAARRRTGLVYSMVALVTVAIVVAAALIWGRSPTGRSHSGLSGANLAAFVTRSAQRTLAQNTADVTLQGAFNIDGIDINLRGNGQLDFASNASTMNLSMSAAHYRIVENVIETSQDLYLRMTINGRNTAQAFGGRHWFETPISDSTSQAQSDGSPVSSLHLLEQHGARIVPMGAQDIGGLNCDEYVVTPAAAQQLPENSTSPTLTIWLDPQRQLLCQLDVYVQLGTAGAVSGSAPSTDAEQLLMTFTHYGVPVTITPPPQSDTVSPGEGAQPA
jgi:hypothetical protein